MANPQPRFTVHQRMYLVAIILAIIGTQLISASDVGEKPWFVVIGALVIIDAAILVLVAAISGRRAKGKPRSDDADGRISNSGGTEQDRQGRALAEPLPEEDTSQD